MTTTKDTAPATTGGRYLKRGDTFDPEDWRMTHRLGVARAILRNQGIEPTWVDHSESCMSHPKNRYNRIPGYSYPCLGDCPRRLNPPPTWPAWATGRLFDLAYQLADEIQDTRGGWNRAQAYEAKRARERGAA